MQETDLALLVDRFMRKIHSGLLERAPGFDREAVGPGGGIVLMTLADAGRISLNELTKCVARDKNYNKTNFWKHRRHHHLHPHPNITQHQK